MKLKESVMDEQILNIAVNHFKINRTDFDEFIQYITDNISDWKYLVNEDIKREELKDQAISETEVKREQLLASGITAEIGGVKIKITKKKDILKYLDASKEFRQEYKNTRGQKSNECVNIQEAAIITNSFCFINSKNIAYSLNDKFYFAGLILALFGRLDNKAPKKGYASNDPYRTYLYMNAKKRIQKIIDNRVSDEDIEGQFNIEKMKGKPAGIIKLIRIKWDRPRLFDTLRFNPGLDKKTFNKVLPQTYTSGLFDLSNYDHKIVKKTITEIWDTTSNPL